jgi:hypothetical protein
VTQAGWSYSALMSATSMRIGYCAPVLDLTLDRPKIVRAAACIDTSLIDR